ncbi:DUF6221 family protein [Streptomyces sp. NPDC005953]|uniref:DUF6221 family protein n=1 Tax=Streptomyces sp. NPDC005953 TaxID=3156719 RepID=UPI0033E5DD9F
MTADLVVFLRERLDGDAAAAERHSCALDCMERIHSDWHRVRLARERGDTVQRLASLGLGLDDVGAWRPEAALHTVHPSKMRGTALDSARVLREVEAKRRLLDLHSVVHRQIGWLEDGSEESSKLPVCGHCVPKHQHYSSRKDVPEGPCLTVRLLAAVYEDHLDYQPGWRP